MINDKTEVSREQLLAELDVLRNRINWLETRMPEPTMPPVQANLDNPNNENFQSMIEGLKDVVFRISMAGVVEYCSPTLQDFGGYDAHQEIGQSIAKYFYKRIEFSRTLQRLKSAALSKETNTIEFIFMPKNKRPFAVEITSKPLQVNGVVVAFFMCDAGYFPA